MTSNPLKHILKNNLSEAQDFIRRDLKKLDDQSKGNSQYKK